MENTNQINSKQDTLVNDLKNVINDAEDLLRSTSQQVGQQFDERYRTARARFEQSLQSAKTGLSSFQQTATARGKEAIDSADQYVKANPWQSVGIGAAAGLILGYLLLRDRD